MDCDRKQAIEYLDAINDSLLKGKDAQDIIDRSEAHVIFYKKWMVFNGCLVYANDFRYLTLDKETGTVTATWREEMPEITIFGNKGYTRRISELYVNSDNRTISFKIPGNIYKNGERGEISINDSGFRKVDKDDKSVVISGDQDFESITIRKTKKEDTSSEENNVESTDTTSSQASEGSDHTPMIPSTFKTKTLKSIRVDRHEKEQGGIELSSCIEIKTLPDSNMSLDNKFSSLTRKQIQEATRINFDASGRMMMYASDNKFAIDVAQLDLDETRVDEDLTTTHEKEAVFQTGVTYHRLALSEVGRMSNFVGDINSLKDDSSMQKRKLAADFIDNLKSAVNTLDGEVITSLLQSTQTIYGLAQAKTASIKDRLKEPPKSAQDFERMHSSSNDTVPNDTLERMLQTYKDDIQDMYAGNQTLDQTLKQNIIAIHRQYPEQTDDSSKAKEDLLNKINAAYHLNETFQFDLLVDPNRGGEIKCSNPDALMLVEEYEMYTNRELIPNEEHYKRSIEDFISETDNVYLKNVLYIRKAEEFANNDNNGDKLNDLVTALKNINGGDRPSISADPNSLEDLRQNAEYHWAKFTHKALSIAKDGGIDEFALGLLREAAKVERSRLKTLKLAKYALNPETLSPLATRAIENDPIDDTPDLSTEMAKKNQQDSNNRKLDNLELEVNQLIQDGLENKNPAAYSKKAVGLAWKLAGLSYRTHLDSIRDPMLKKDFEARSIEITTKMAEQSLTEFKAILGLLHYQDQKKLMKSMMWHELLVVLATNGYVQLRQFQNRIGNVFQRLIADLFKIAGISK